MRGWIVTHRSLGLEHPQGRFVKRICQPHNWFVQSLTLFHNICVVVNFGNERGHAPWLSVSPP